MGEDDWTPWRDPFGSFNHILYRYVCMHIYSHLFLVGALLRAKGGPPVLTITGSTFSAFGPGLSRPPAYAQNLFTCCLRLTCSQVQHLQWAVRWRARVTWVIVFNVYDNTHIYMGEILKMIELRGGILPNPGRLGWHRESLRRFHTIHDCVLLLLICL